MTATPVPISKRDPFTFSIWVKPAEADQDVALLSALDYSQNTAAASYGSGIELRLKNEPQKDEGLNLPFSSRHFVECLKVGAEKFGWSQRNPKEG